MRFAAVLVLLVACSDPAPLMPDAAPDAPPSPVTSGPCTDFVKLFSGTGAGWEHGSTFIAPLGKPVFVTGADFSSLEGESSPQTDGTTRVWAGKEYHFDNGATQAGAVGRRTPDGPCEWAIAVRTE